MLADATTAFLEDTSMCTHVVYTYDVRIVFSFVRSLYMLLLCCCLFSSQQDWLLYIENELSRCRRSVTAFSIINFLMEFILHIACNAQCLTAYASHSFCRAFNYFHTQNTTQAQASSTTHIIAMKHFGRENKHNTLTLNKWRVCVAMCVIYIYMLYVLFGFRISEISDVYTLPFRCIIFV